MSGSVSTVLDGMASAPWEDQEKGYGMILKILQNIKKNPSEQKFRSIKASSGALAKVLALPGGADFLLAVGFTLADEQYTLAGDDVTSLNATLALVEAHANKSKGAELRRVRDAEIAIVKADRAVVNHLKGDGNLKDDPDLQRKIDQDRLEFDAARANKPTQASKANIPKFGVAGFKTAQDVIPQGGGG